MDLAVVAAEAGDGAGGGGADDRVREAEMRGVEEVEQFGAVLQAEAFAEGEGLKQRPIPVGAAGAIEDIATGVAIGELGGGAPGGIGGAEAGVEEEGAVPAGERGGTEQHGPGGAGVGGVAVDGGRIGQTGLPGEDDVGLPAAWQPHRALCFRC